MSANNSNGKKGRRPSAALSRAASIWLAACILLGTGRRASAGSAGAEPFDFLLMDAGARPVAMGGASSALAQDSEALVYNPAALGRGSRYETTFMHNQYISPISQEYVGFASPRGWGAQLNYLSFGRVSRTTISSPDGTGGTFGINDLALGVGYGREVTPGFRAGVAGKLIRETIDSVSSNGYAVDFGGLWRLPAGPRAWTFGAALQNLGPATRFHSASESLPWLMRLGAACEVKTLGKPATFAVDLLKERSESPAIAFGAEAWVAPAFAVRLGYSGRNDAGPGVTAGFGWRRQDFQFDYALSPLGELGSAHRLSATVRWGKGDEDSSGSQGVVSERLLEPVARSTMTAEPDRRLQAVDEFIKLDMLAQAEKELAELAPLLGPDDPRNVQRLQRLGDLFRRQGKMREAKLAYTDALTLAIRLGLRNLYAADAYAGMGHCLVAERNTELATRFFEKSLEAGASPDTAKAVEAELSRLRKR